MAGLLALNRCGLVLDRCDDVDQSWSDVGRSWLDVALGSNLDRMWLRETRKGVPIKLDFQSASCCAIGELGLGCW